MSGTVYSTHDYYCYLQSLVPIIGGVGAGVLVAVAIVVVSIDTRPSPILASFVHPFLSFIPTDAYFQFCCLWRRRLRAQSNER
jgi:hypothetical protein